MRPHRPVQPSIQIGSQANIIKNEFGLTNPVFEPDFGLNNPMGRTIPDNFMRRQPNTQVPFSVEPLAQPVPNIPITTSRERRSKKHFDSQFRVQPDIEELMNQGNSENLERRSGSNNRVGVNEEGITERSKPDSYLFQLNEEEDNNSINKDSPQNTQLNPYPQNIQENEPIFGDFLSKIPQREIVKQESNRFIGYDVPAPNESFGGNSFTFKQSEVLDYSDPKFNPPFNTIVNNNMNYNQGASEFRSFQIPPMNRMHQSSFNSNPFESMSRNQSFGPDFSTNVMNPSNMQYNDSIRSQMTFNNDGSVKRNNSFSGKKR